MTEETIQTVLPPKPTEADRGSSLLRTIISMSLYIIVDYWIFKNWIMVGILVGVVLFHELGHFTFMKIFGYKGVNMTFVPFIGAYVSGEVSRFSKKEKLIVLMAGPLPGTWAGPTSPTRSSPPASWRRCGSRLTTSTR